MARVPHVALEPVVRRGAGRAGDQVVDGEERAERDSLRLPRDDGEDARTRIHADDGEGNESRSRIRPSSSKCGASAWSETRALVARGCFWQRHRDRLSPTFKVSRRPRRVVTCGFGGHSIRICVTSPTRRIAGRRALRQVRDPLDRSGRVETTWRGRPRSGSWPSRRHRRDFRSNHHRVCNCRADGAPEALDPRKLALAAARRNVFGNCPAQHSCARSSAEF